MTRPVEAGSGGREGVWRSVFDLVRIAERTALSTRMLQCKLPPPIHPFFRVIGNIACTVVAHPPDDVDEAGGGRRGWR